MFKQIASIAQMMKQAQAMQGRVQELKQRLEETRVTGTAGAGLIEVDASGDQKVTAVRIHPDLVSGDRARLETLVAAATNDALDRAKRAAAELMQSMTGDMPGFDDALSKLGSFQ